MAVSRVERSLQETTLMVPWSPRSAVHRIVPGSQIRLVWGQVFHDPSAPLRESKPLPNFISKLPLIAALLLVVLLVVPVLLSSRIPVVSPVDGPLRPCGKAPNCVSSQADDEAHRVEPLRVPEGMQPHAAFARFLDLLEARRDARVHVRAPLTPPTTFAHVEFVTPYLRFRDDVELLLDPGAGLVHVRSASRVGYSDFGKNRARVEELRALLAGVRVP
jgi:uncharacterized protein (DUF1499 family)